MDETTKINKKNIYRFLRAFAKDISIPDLQLIPGDCINITFYYHHDRILKVPKNASSRIELLKETKLLQYLHAQQWPAAVPEPLLLHPEGFYAVFSRLAGRELSAETVADFTPEARATFARSIGTFLSLLHTHQFPPDLANLIPPTENGLHALLKRSQRKLGEIKQTTQKIDTSQWEDKLANLQNPPPVKPVVTQSELVLRHIFAIDNGPTPFAIIDFAGAELNDPALDFAEFATDLREKVDDPDSLLAMMLKHYPTDDPAFIQKIEWFMLTHEIYQTHRQIRKTIA